MDALPPLKTDSGVQAFGKMVVALPRCQVRMHPEALWVACASLCRESRL